MRGTFTGIAGAPRFEQAFSADGGKTWETNWINTYARIDERDIPRPSAQPEAHDFDFEQAPRLPVLLPLDPPPGAASQ